MASSAQFFAVATAVVAASLLAASNVFAAAESCPPDDGVALQVLGSGGPIADDERAGSAYLVWINGQSRILIDIGSGAFLRFAESGADFTALDLIGLSHFHVDHTADLAALLKSGSFGGRTRALIIAGPSAAGRFPGLRDFMDSLLNPDKGAYAYLGGYLDGRGRLPKLALFEVHENNTSPVLLLGAYDGTYQVTALQVSHGIVPALAYRVRANGKTVVVAGDQDGNNEGLAEFSSEADILVLHMPVPESATGTASNLHARPSSLGQLANESNARSVVISHLMRRSLVEVDKNLDRIQSRFDGALYVADDLACYVVN